MTRIYDPPVPHRCHLPLGEGCNASGLRAGAVEVCDDCGAVWIYDPIPWEQTWRRLRPWPFDRRAREALREVRQ